MLWLLIIIGWVILYLLLFGGGYRLGQIQERRKHERWKKSLPVLETYHPAGVGEYVRMKVRE